MSATVREGLIFAVFVLTMYTAHQLSKMAKPTSVKPSACSVELEETRAVADFWRNQALSMRTEGVDSLRPVPENDKEARKDL